MLKSLQDPQQVQRHLGRPAPPPVRRLAAVRPPAADPHRRHRPHVLLPRLRRQPDGLQRLPDDRARLPQPAARAEEARRADGGLRPAAHRDGEGRRRAPLRADRPPTPSYSWRWCTSSSRRDWPTHRPTCAASSRCGSPSPTSPRSTPREASGVPAEEIRRITREFAAADGAAAYGRVGLSTQGFGSLCQWALNLLNILTGNFDREGGMLFPEPAVDIVGQGDRGSRPLRRLAQPGARRAGVRRRAAGQHAARGDRDPRRGTDPRHAHRRRQPGALDPGRRRGSRARSTAWTSWRPSTSTSTRRPGTPT